MVLLLHSLFQNHPDYFYTNDIAVIVDISLRLLTRVTTDETRGSILRLFPLLVGAVSVDSPGVEGGKKGLVMIVTEKLKIVLSNGVTSPSVQSVIKSVLGQLSN